jgi:hypothetical protein
LGTIAKEKIPAEKYETIIDKRLQDVNIPKGLIESLVNAGFTIETILNSDPSDIAEVLRIDDYVAQIIYQETKYYYQVQELLSP